MLLPPIIDDGYARGFDELDFLTGEESYKSRWTTGYHHTACVRIRNRRPISRMCAAAYLALRPGPPTGSVWSPESSSHDETILLKDRSLDVPQHH
jgi:hypothetical protein